METYIGIAFTIGIIALLFISRIIRLIAGVLFLFLGIFYSFFFVPSDAAMNMTIPGIVFCAVGLLLIFLGIKKRNKKSQNSDIYIQFPNIQAPEDDIPECDICGARAKSFETDVEYNGKFFERVCRHCYSKITTEKRKAAFSEKK